VANEFRLPDMGEGLTEAEIVEWRVAVGDVVDRDQVVVDVETDKAVVEVPIPVAGTVLHLGGEPGTMLAVGEILVVVGDPDETWSPPQPSGSADAAPIVGTLSTEVVSLPPAASDRTVGGKRAPALPAVRRLARNLGVDLDAVTPTGPGGRILPEDVERAAEAADEAPEPSVDDAAAVDRAPAAGPDDPEVPDPADGRSVRAAGERRPLSRTRRTIAANMSRSWAEIPHVTTFDEVDATRLLEVKQALSRRHGQAVSIDALVAKAVVPALAVHPDFNSTLDGDDLVDNPSIDLGVAVDTSDGLMVVVVRDVASRTLVELSAEIASLAAAARSRVATASQLTGQTFTVSNIGALGGGFGTPIVPHGTVAILSVGRAVERPAARDGSVVVAPMMPLSLSYDHRVIDGGQGRRFMSLVAENLAEPALFLAD